MKLVLRRDLRKGMLGTIIFSLSVRAEITPEEREAILVALSEAAEVLYSLPQHDEVCRAVLSPRVR